MTRKEIIGNATLYLGDCMEVLPELGQLDAIVTDPPYGIGFVGSATKDSPEVSGIGYLSFVDTPENIAAIVVPRIEIAIRQARRVALTPGIANHRLYPKPAAEGVFWYPAGANSGPWGFVTHQPIFYYGACPYLATGKGRRPTGMQATMKAEDNGHPCPKPIDQMIWLVNRVSLEGEVVTDPFMGSGTTGVACMTIGRGFIGIEIEPAYFDIACRRIEDAQRQTRMFA